jgi:hypothetical protein
VCESADDKPPKASTGALLLKRMVHDKLMRMGLAGKANQGLGLDREKRERFFASSWITCTDAVRILQGRKRAPETHLKVGDINRFENNFLARGFD